MSEALQPPPSGIEESVRKAVGNKSMRWGLESPDELIGSRIDNRFTIVERIARGGMGAVFKAIQAPMGRVCAVKVLSATYEGKKDPAFDKRFRREAATIARLQHPSTVTLYDYGNIADLYYMAMEYVEGRNLHAEIYHEGRFEERRALRIAMQICRSLREAHEHGVVHRDLKPDNVVLVDRANETDQVKVLDFGLAKVIEGELADEDVTETGLCMGSPKHMAPEQIIGDEVSAHTDIYALGILMYEMLLGCSPFDRPTRYQTLVAQVHDPPMPFRQVVPDATVSAETERIVMQCLEKKKHRRFASMNDVLHALKTVERGSRASMSSMPSVTGASSLVSVPGEEQVENSGRVPFSSSLPDAKRPSRHSVYPPASQSPVPPKNPAQPSQAPSVRNLPPLPPLPVVAEVPARRIHKPLIAGGLVGIVGVMVALGTWLTVRTPTAGLSASTSLAGFASAMVWDATRAPAKSDVRRRVVRVESVPPGASVFEQGDALCESTPCDVTWVGQEKTRAHTLRLELAGFVEARHEVSAGEDNVRVSLVPANRGAVNLPVEVGGEELADDTGYKYSPY